MIIIIKCSHLMISKWLHLYLIPCPFKKLSGFDCPGCGFQRSLIALIQGNFNKSLQLYPATILILLIAVILILEKTGLKLKLKPFKRILIISASGIIAISYLIKLAHYSNV